MNYFTSAIANQGFRQTSLLCCGPDGRLFCRVSLTHCNPKAFKTDAPFDMVWDMLRAWIKEQPLNQKPEPGSVAAKILEKVRSLSVRLLVYLSTLYELGSKI